MLPIARTHQSKIWQAVLAGLVWCSAAYAQEETSRSQPAKPKPAFDQQADAEADIAAAIAKAKCDNKRVLLMFGANWCGWSGKLDQVFKENGQVARTLLYEYELVKVDVGRRDKNMNIAELYGADVENGGIPYLTVLDGDGKVLVNKETGALEVDDRHDPMKVQAFLQKWKAEPRDARKVLKDALARAAKQDKRLFLHFGVPSCKWCRRLDEFLACPDIVKIMGRDFLAVKIDIDRMTAGQEVEKRFRPSASRGRPWLAVLDAEARVLATSDGPKGNIGFPVEPHEIAHFIDVLKKTARRISAGDLRKIEQAFKE